MSTPGIEYIIVRKDEYDVLKEIYGRYINNIDRIKDKYHEKKMEKEKLIAAGLLVRPKRGRPCKD